MDKVISNLMDEGNHFCENLKKVRSISCIDGHFGRFVGSKAMIEAQKAAEESEEKKQEIITALRTSIQPLYQDAAAWKHSLEKPYGYPGDFSILEMVYNNEPHPNTETARGKIIDLWAATTPLSRAVNARKNALRVYIEEFAEQFSAEKKAKVLSIASGSAREIRDLSQASLDKLDITLLDRDKRALSFFQGFFYGYANQKPPTVVIADALKPFADAPGFPTDQEFDLIYSFGLYDYLPDELIKISIDNATKYLNNSGTFVFALKDHRYYPQWFYDWFYNWKFFARTKEDGYTLAQNSGLKVEDTILVDSGTIALYICKK